MLKRILIALTLSTLSLSFPLSGGILVRGTLVDLSDDERPWMTAISLEHATTPNQIQWGLMQRERLPRNHGMTFTFQHADNLTFWSFNCLIDLSVAYLSDDKVIREIHQLEAHPDKMDPMRKVSSLKDMSLYDPAGPVYTFFQENSIKSTAPTKYAMEMNGGWFVDNDVQVGDIVIWHPRSRLGFVLHTLNLDDYPLVGDEPVMIEFSGKYPQAVWLPETAEARDVAFLTEKMEMVLKRTVQGGQNLPPKQRPVLASGVPIKYCLVAPPGWLKKHLIKGGITVDNDFMIEVERLEDNPRKGKIALNTQ